MTLIVILFLMNKTVLGSDMDFKKQTYSLQVTQFIRGLIQQGKLKPGDPIKEAELSAYLKISRAPIREALQILVQEGLVSAEPQKGKNIRVLTPKEITDGYSITAILESEAVILSLDKWTKEDFADLKHILETIKDKSKHVSDVDELQELDELLHNMLLSHCDNEQLIDIARLSSSNISKYLCYPYWRECSKPVHFYERHKLVVEAILTKDPQKIREAIRSHYNELAVQISERVKNQQN